MPAADTPTGVVPLLIDDPTRQAEGRHEVSAHLDEGAVPGGLRFHDLRHSYATWLVDDGVPPNMVQRVLGHEHASTTLDLYTRRTDNTDRILRALDDPQDDDPDDDGGGVLAPI